MAAQISASPSGAQVSASPSANVEDAALADYESEMRASREELLKKIARSSEDIAGRCRSAAEEYPRLSGRPHSRPCARPAGLGAAAAPLGARIAPQLLPRRGL